MGEHSREAQLKFLIASLNRKARRAFEKLRRRGLSDWDAAHEAAGKPKRGL